MQEELLELREKIYPIRNYADRWFAYHEWIWRTSKSIHLDITRRPNSDDSLIEIRAALKQDFPFQISKEEEQEFDLRFLPEDIKQKLAQIQV